MEPREHQSLAEITSLHLGGTARYCVDATTLDELRAAVSFATTHALRWSVLGSGQSTLAPDAGFDGLVIRCIGQQRQHLHAGSLVFAGDTLGAEGSVGALALHGTLATELIDEYHWLTELGAVQVVPGHQWAATGYQHAHGILFGVVPKHDLPAPPPRPQPHAATARVFHPLDGVAASSIADVGWAGKVMGKVLLWAEDPTWLIANPGATADEVVQLMSLVKQQVRDTLGVQLRDTLSYLGM
jgi:UDP-N-acetylmuramate dehydrogenase